MASPTFIMAKPVATSAEQKARVPQGAHALCSALRGEVILGYTEEELCSTGSGYQFVHAADMIYCAESHVRGEC